eukprot:9451150-Pyramimonas_sp.AAC.1
MRTASSAHPYGMTERTLMKKLRQVTNRRREEGIYQGAVRQSQAGGGNVPGCSSPIAGRRREYTSGGGGARALGVIDIRRIKRKTESENAM